MPLRPAPLFAPDYPLLRSAPLPSSPLASKPLPAWATRRPADQDSRPVLWPPRSPTLCAARLTAPLSSRLHAPEGHTTIVHCPCWPPAALPRCAYDLSLQRHRDVAF